MKKIFSKEIFLILIFTFTLFVSVNKVNADENTSIAMSGFYSGFDNAITYYNNHRSLIETAISTWEDNYSEDFPYYFISYIPAFGSSNDSFVLTYYDIPYIYTDNSQPILGIWSLITPQGFSSTCWQENRNYCYGQIYSNSSNTSLEEILSTTPGSRINPTFFSNNNNSPAYPLYNNGFIFKGDTNYGSTINTLQFPPYTSTTYEESYQYFEVNVNDLLPSYLTLYQGSFEPTPNYVEINLNNYAYVALSLRNYDVQEAFSTNMIVKGQLCITPVYDYGMTEKSTYSGAGYQVESCTIAYDNFTPMQTYILQSDLTYHAIYYLKAYNTNIENKVKIDSNIFNITYITSENANNPQVNINGRSYPTIPYDNLQSSATISTEEGYVSGQVKNIWDTSMSEETINSLFANPLQALGSIWTTIIAMFSLIGSFIVLLPSTLQTFLFVAFATGITLGLLKIIL